jgi:hypothetical protein
MGAGAALALLAGAETAAGKTEARDSAARSGAARFAVAGTADVALSRVGAGVGWGAAAGAAAATARSIGASEGAEAWESPSARLSRTEGGDSTAELGAAAGSPPTTRSSWISTMSAASPAPAGAALARGRAVGSRPDWRARRWK